MSKSEGRGGKYNSKRVTRKVSTVHRGGGKSRNDVLDK